LDYNSELRSSLSGVLVKHSKCSLIVRGQIRKEKLD
jgi:hypothetical protein